MAGPRIFDMVFETTTTTGTGTITLAGAETGYQSFAVVGNANTCFYTIRHRTAAEYEVGIGTYTAAGTTLARTTILASSNGDLVVSLSAGTKDVVLSGPAALLGITGLTAETAVATGDEIAIYDASATAVRKMTQNNFIPDSSDTVKGKIEIAVQSEMETGTSTTQAVVPGRMQFHPGYVKVWSMFDGAATTPGDSDVGFNVTSIDDNGTGSYDVNFTTAFSDAFVGFVLGVKRDNAGTSQNITIVATSEANNPQTTDITLRTQNVSQTAIDATYVNVACFGDQ